MVSTFPYRRALLYCKSKVTYIFTSKGFNTIYFILQSPLVHAHNNTQSITTFNITLPSLSLFNCLIFLHQVDTRICLVLSRVVTGKKSRIPLFKFVPSHNISCLQKHCIYIFCHRIDNEMFGIIKHKRQHGFPIVHVFLPDWLAIAILTR